MRHSTVCVLFSVFLFPHIQSNTFNLLKYYEDSVNFLVSRRFSNTKYCASILSPTVETLDKSLKATFVPAEESSDLNEEYNVDLCCRSLHKCDAHKRNEVNHTTELHMKHCGCVHLFQTCLKDLNTSLSNEVAFIHVINATKCYSKDHPIVKCIQFDSYSESKDELFRFINIAERETYFKRCVKYDLDENRPRKLQTFDVPFNVNFVKIQFADELDEYIENMDKTTKFEEPTAAANAVLKLIMDAKIFGCTAYEAFFDRVEPNIQVTETADPKMHAVDMSKLKFVLKFSKHIIKLSCESGKVFQGGMPVKMIFQNHYSNRTISN